MVWQGICKRKACAGKRLLPSSCAAVILRTCHSAGARIGSSVLRRPAVGAQGLERVPVRVCSVQRRHPCCLTALLLLLLEHCLPA